MSRRGGAVLLIVVAGCGPAATAAVSVPKVVAPAPRAEASVPPVVRPAASLKATAAVAASPPAEGAKDWIAAVPQQPVAARVGDLVWAVFPAGDEVRVEPCQVRAITQAGATLEADDHSIHPNVSGALIHPVTSTAALEIGDVVTYFDWRRDFGLAVVARRDYTKRLDIKFRDSARVVRDEPVHVVEPLPSAVGPLAWVAFPYPAAPDPRPLYRGFVFAADDTRLFVRDDANRAWVVPKDGVKVLGVSHKPRKEGDPVSAFEYGQGYRPGTIRKVFDPGYAYGVARAGEDAVRSFYFSDVVDAP